MVGISNSLIIFKNFPKNCALLEVYISYGSLVVIQKNNVEIEPFLSFSKIEDGTSKVIKYYFIKSKDCGNISITATLNSTSKSYSVNAEYLKVYRCNLEI